MRIFVIEDDENDANDIKEALQEIGLEAVIGGRYDTPTFLDYMSGSDSSLVVIVDLHWGGETGIAEGREAMLRMWKIDRTTIFVVFSQHAGNSSLFDAGTLAPAHIVVKKVRDAAGRLNADCLENLKGGVQDASKGVIRPSSFCPLNVKQWAQVLEQLLVIRGSDGKKKVFNEERLVQDTINAFEENEKVIEKLVPKLDVISYSGSIASQIVAVVFGSYGRGEARKSSDFEFSTLFFEGSENRESVEDVAVVSWNRSVLAGIKVGIKFQNPRRDMAENHLTVEGRRVPLVSADKWSEVAVREEGWEKVADIEAIKRGLKDGFSPIVDADALIDAVIKSEGRPGNYLNKCFQFLVEYKGLYNCSILEEAQKKLLQAVFKDCELTRDIAHSPILVNMIDYFEKSTMTSWRILRERDCKAFAFRYLNVVALKAMLGRIVFLEEFDFGKDKEYKTIISDLGEPGAIKVARCAHAAHKAGREGLRDAALEWVSYYLKVLERTRIDSGPRESYSRDLKLAMLAASKYFQVLGSEFRDCGWLAEHQKVGDSAFFS